MADVEIVQTFLDNLVEQKQAGSEAVAALFADDAKVLPNHHVAVIGKQYIQQYYENKAQSDPNKELQMKFNVTDVSDAADYVIVDGDFRVSRKEHELDHGKFLLVLKKVDDSFQVFRIMMNTNRGTAVHGDQKCGADAPHHDAPHQD